VVQFIDEYHKVYEEARIWEKNTWMGVPCWKLPMDAFVLQELIWKLKPDFIIETGTGKGGSAMFYASICELMGQGKVITCDVDLCYDVEQIAQHEWSDRIHFIHGSSTNSLTLKEIKKIVGDTTNNIVLLDSDHRCNHVLTEIGAYEAFVGKGYYMIVEDTHAGNPGHPVKWKYDNEGAYEAVEAFLEMSDDFEVDWECEKHLMSFNPKGYLRRIK
jgi:cephalosporin hydroxylase